MNWGNLRWACHEGSDADIVDALAQCDADPLQALKYVKDVRPHANIITGWKGATFTYLPADLPFGYSGHLNGVVEVGEHEVCVCELQQVDVERWAYLELIRPVYEDFWLSEQGYIMSQDRQLYWAVHNYIELSDRFYDSDCEVGSGLDRERDDARRSIGGTRRFHAFWNDNTHTGAALNVVVSQRHDLIPRLRAMNCDVYDVVGFNDSVWRLALAQWFVENKGWSLNHEPRGWSYSHRGTQHNEFGGVAVGCVAVGCVSTYGVAVSGQLIVIDDPWPERGVERALVDEVIGFDRASVQVEGAHTHVGSNEVDHVAMYAQLAGLLASFGGECFTQHVMQNMGIKNYYYDAARRQHMFSMQNGYEYSVDCSYVYQVSKGIQ